VHFIRPEVSSGGTGRVGVDPFSEKDVDTVLNR
jgi:hypothetical protein